MCKDLQHCFSSLRFADICLCTALLMSRHSVWIRLRSGLGCAPATLWFFSFSSFSVVDLLVSLQMFCCCCWSVCWTDGLRFASIRRSCDFKRSGRVAAKQYQISSPPPPYFTVSIWCLCWYVICTAEREETRGFLLATLPNNTFHFFPNCIVMNFNI